MIDAHIGGLPFEEVLLPAVSTGAAGLLVARSWILVQVRRRRAGDR